MKPLAFLLTMWIAAFAAMGTSASAGAGDVDAIHRLESEWSKSLVTRDSQWFQNVLVDDWKVVLPEGAVLGKPEFLKALQAGSLSRAEGSDLKIRIYGDTAIAIGRHEIPASSPRLPSVADQRRTNVYVRVNDEWKCVTTHISTIDLMRGSVP